jgi:Tfp pilus assembly protein PilX
MEQYFFQLLLLAISTLLAVVAKLLHWLYVQHKEMQKEKDAAQDEALKLVRDAEEKLRQAQAKQQKTELGRIADKIAEIVDQNRTLFAKHDNTEERVTVLEKKCESHVTRCIEREKKIDTMFDYFSNNCCDASRRKSGPPHVDRSDRSD